MASKQSTVDSYRRVDFLQVFGERTSHRGESSSEQHGMRLVEIFSFSHSEREKGVCVMESRKAIRMSRMLFWQEV